MTGISERDLFRGYGLAYDDEIAPDEMASGCGAWMPKAHERCARRPGHSSRSGPSHRTRYALDNNRDARWFGVQRKRVAS